MVSPAGRVAEPPPLFLAQRKGPGCVEINGALMGRQARARPPGRMPPGEPTLGRGASDPPQAGGAGALVPAPGRWALRSPRPVLPALPSRPGHCRRSSPAAATPAKAAGGRRAEGRPGRAFRTPGGPAPAPGSAGRLPAGKTALRIKHIYIYIYICMLHCLRSRPSGKGCEALGAASGGGRAGAPPERGRPTRVRCCGQVRGLQDPGPARSAEVGGGASSRAPARPVPLARLRKAAARAPAGLASVSLASHCGADA